MKMEWDMPVPDDGDRDSGVKSLILIPDEANHVQVHRGETGGVSIRWVQACCDSENGHDDTWEVVISPSRHHVDVFVSYGLGHDCTAVGLLDAVKHILTHQSGMSVDISLCAIPA